MSWYSAEAMARLGRKALQQIQETDLGLSADVHGDNPLRSPQASRNKRIRAVPARHRVDSTTSTDLHFEPCTQEYPQCDTVGYQGWGIGNMADLDNLFQDFLDLSLPTNL
jgi:hypothetical protein